jgi:hypothetical protein
VGLAEDSRSTIMTGDELTVADSGDVLWEETSKLRPLGPPLLDSIDVEATGNITELLSYSYELYMASTHGAQICRS